MISRLRPFWPGIVVASGVLASLVATPAQAQNTVFPTISNRYITVRIDPTSSSFSITKNEGDPLDPRDDGLAVTWNNVLLVTKATLWVSSNTAALGARTGRVGFAGGLTTSRPSVTDNGQTLETQWVFPAALPDAEGIDVLVTQRLTLVRDLVRIEYKITNRGTSRSIGLRFAVDPAVENSDTITPPFFTPNAGYFTTEKDFNRSNVPAFWRQEYTPFNRVDPHALIQQVFTGLDAVRPDRVVFGGEGPLILASGNGIGPLPDWDYTINPSQDITGPPPQGDGSVATFWNPMVMGTGQSRTLVTYMGVGVATHNRNAVMVGAVQAPLAVPLIGGQPQSFRTHAYAHNLSTLFNIPSVTAVLSLPEGLRFNSNVGVQDDILVLGSLQPAGTNPAAAERSGFWDLEATGFRAGIQDVDVIFNSALGGSFRVTRQVHVPQGTTYRLKSSYQMLTFPFEFANSSPSAALGLEPGDFTMLQWNPVAFEYEPVTSIEPGRAYWVRFFGAGDEVIDLNGATAERLETTDYTKTVNAGWNMIGNPTPYAVPLRELRFLRGVGALPVNYETAIRNGLIRPTAWWWDANDTNPQYRQLTPNDYAQPGMGIWLFANSDLIVLWPQPVGPGIEVQP